MHATLFHPARRARQLGLSLIELVMFIVVLGLALTAVLKAFTQATAASVDPQLRRQALAIAESLMEEVQLMPFTYCDTDDANVETAQAVGDCASLPEALGPEAGETRYATPQFDNVNDYHGLAMTGIADITNSPVSGLSAYSASVSVAADDLGSLSAASGDALRITVSVTGPDGSTLTLDGYRSRHAPHAAL
ncbi:MAG: type II secretion system protein [Vitreoscilla sp.]|nr:type II secretion system protein [Burkholderiales bacterium]MBP6336274.1 type II secretion system protein [Vitreoscilla sp.]